jgi:predicted ATP-dependent endonuclease of OLD family
MDLSVFKYSGNNYKKIYSSAERVNIADLGKGISGIVGLILKIHYVLEDLKKENNRLKIDEGYDTKNNPQPKLILIEEPEAFLHPKFQSKLVDFFAFCLEETKYYNIKFIIETHSEYLIRKLQYLVAKKELNPDDVKIYYFHDPNNIPKGEKQIKELTIREDGMMDDDFGPGFFDESTRLTMDLLKLQSRN